MRVRDLASETWEALDANRGRSFLTVLGIVIGISAVIAMTALIGGIKSSILDEMGATQARSIMMNVYGNRPFSYQNLEQMRKDFPEYEAISPVANNYGDLSGDKEKVSSQILGVEADYAKLNGIKLLAGRNFTEQEDASASLVALIDEASAKKLFGTTPEQSIGKSFRFNGTSFKVIGVTEVSASMMGGGSTLFPYKTLTSRINGDTGINNMVGLFKEGTDSEALVKKTTSYLEKATGSEPASDEEGMGSSIFVTSMKSIIDSVNTAIAGFQAMMTSVASISLLVGGIGIMNMMLTNVTERIREIGLRKALGAKNSDITLQFLMESVALCLVGGAFGLILGYGGAFALTGIASSIMGNGAQISPVLDLQSILFATGTCVFIGVIFGYYPARRAAKLDPVESLHYQ